MADDEKEFNETQASRNKFSLSKTDLELFDEEKANKIAPIIRVKRVLSPTKDEKWNIYKNGQIIFVVEGHRLSKKERLFLQTLEGVGFLIQSAKDGIKSIADLKKKIKEVLPE